VALAGNQIVSSALIGPNSYTNKYRTANMNVLTMLNGRERSLGDWRSIVTLASDKLEITAALTPLGAYFTVLEIGWK
jgi:hypothetical protein